MNKHWWSILSWAKFSPHEMTSYSCMWPVSANFATTRAMKFIRNKLHSQHIQSYLGKVFSRPSSLAFPGHFRWQELFISSEFVHGFLCCFRCCVWSALFLWRHRARITHSADCARTRKLFSVPCARRVNEILDLALRIFRTAPYDFEFADEARSVGGLCSSSTPPLAMIRIWSALPSLHSSCLLHKSLANLLSCGSALID